MEGREARVSVVFVAEMLNELNDGVDERGIGIVGRDTVHARPERKPIDQEGRHAVGGLLRLARVVEIDAADRLVASGGYLREQIVKRFQRERMPARHERGERDVEVLHRTREGLAALASTARPLFRHLRKRERAIGQDGLPRRSRRKLNEPDPGVADGRALVESERWSCLSHQRVGRRLRRQRGRRRREAHERCQHRSVESEKKMPFLAMEVMKSRRVETCFW